MACSKCNHNQHLTEEKLLTNILEKHVITEISFNSFLEVDVAKPDSI